MLGVWSTEAAVTHITVMYSKTDREQQSYGSLVFHNFPSVCFIKTWREFCHVVRAARCAGVGLHSGKLHSGCKAPRGALRGDRNPDGFLWSSLYKGL